MEGVFLFFFLSSLELKHMVGGAMVNIIKVVVIVRGEGFVALNGLSSDSLQVKGL